MAVQDRDSQKRQTKKRIPPGMPRMQTQVAGLKPGMRGFFAREKDFQQMLDGGYTFVTTDSREVQIDQYTMNSLDLGSLVSRKSDDTRAYLMQIPEEDYRDNRRQVHESLDVLENALLNRAGDDVRVMKDQTSVKQGRTRIEGPVPAGQGHNRISAEDALKDLL